MTKHRLEIVDESGNEVEVVANKKRPYKVYAVIAIAFLTTLIAQPLDVHPWVKGVIVSVVAGLTVYVTPNPLTTFLKQQN